MRLSDEVIAHVAKLLQIAILTGTDVVDHLRMIRLDLKDDTLTLDADYSAHADDNIQTLLNEITAVVEQEN